MYPPSLCPHTLRALCRINVFKYLGFHQLCKLSPSIKAAVWSSAGKLGCAVPWARCAHPSPGPEGARGWDTAREWGTVAQSIPASAGTKDFASSLFPGPVCWKSFTCYWKSCRAGWCCKGNQLGWVLFEAEVVGAACWGKQDTEKHQWQ